MLLAAVAIAAYLMGSIPFGVLLARRRGLDIRKTGSGNIGATNVARTLGKKLGALVLLLDALKGALPVLAAGTLQLDFRAVTIAGLAAILGHCFPLWLRFHGGKGVATALGVFLAVDPLATAASILVFALTYALSRLSSVGSLAASAAFPIVLWQLGRPRDLLLLGIGVALLIVVRHQDNLRRLRRGEETRI